MSFYFCLHLFICVYITPHLSTKGPGVWARQLTNPVAIYIYIYRSQYIAYIYISKSPVGNSATVFASSSSLCSYSYSFSSASSSSSSFLPSSSSSSHSYCHPYPHLHAHLHAHCSSSSFILRSPKRTFWKVLGFIWSSSELMLAIRDHNRSQRKSKGPQTKRERLRDFSTGGL